MHVMESAVCVHGNYARYLRTAHVLYWYRKYSGTRYMYASIGTLPICTLGFSFPVRCTNSAVPLVYSVVASGRGQPGESMHGSFRLAARKRTMLRVGATARLVFLSLVRSLLFLLLQQDCFPPPWVEPARDATVKMRQMQCAVRTMPGEGQGKARS
jgi:hypothetical protein